MSDLNFILVYFCLLFILNITAIAKSNHLIEYVDNLFFGSKDVLFIDIVFCFLMGIFLWPLIVFIGIIFCLVKLATLKVVRREK